MGRILSLLVVAPLLVAAASAQTTSVTDGKTPTGLTPGAPAGTYALSGFDNVNLFNGNLNFHLPLLNIGGRGSAGYTITLPIEQKWIVKKGQPDPFGITPLTPNPNWWQGIKPGYSPGVLHGRRTGYGEYPYENYCGYVPNVFDQTLTRLTFTGSDGTEYELRDQLTNGAPGDVSSVPCNQQGTSRGTVFVTGDGSAATFISDATIYDYKWLDINLSNRLFYPSGYLLLRDGRRYRIDSGYVSWIRDRNGNKITTFGGSTTGGTITDSINRKVTVALNSGVGYDEISYSGFPGLAGGARKIRVWYDSLSNLLRPNSGYSIQTYYGLFPNLNSASTYSTYNPGRVSKVELPDGRLYQFYYNPYGELARVVLPTGGAFEYDWDGGADPTDGTILRYVTERRVYLVAGGTAESKTQYIRDGSGASMEVKTFNGAGTTLLTRSLHYFNGDAWVSLAGEPNSAVTFSPWLEGREYRTETFDIVNGTPVLKQKVDQTWQQPVAGSTWPLTQAETAGDVKANDPQITQTLTTLSDTNQVTKQTFLYDRYSNRTDAYEFDYGSPTAGSLIRRTHTDYLTTNAVNGYDYACNPTTTCGNGAVIGNVIHIRSLATQQQVFDAGGIEKSRATIEYDNYAGANHAALWPLPNISGLCTYHDAAGNCYSPDDPAHPPASYSPRGNQTATISYILGTPTTSISAYTQYDIAGNVIKVIDGRGYATNIYYSDCFGGPDGNARLNSQPLELSAVSQFSYAFPTSVTNFYAQTTYSQFDYYTGQPVDGEDVNGIVASGYYNDLLDRPTQVIRAANQAVGIKGQTSFVYDDVNRIITSTSDLNAINDNLLKSQTLYDGLGRTIESRQYESATAFITTMKTYDALGRAFKVSNPFRPWQSEVAIWTTTAFDALGRVLSLTTPDSAVVATSYSGNTVTVTDQTSKARKSVTDGLGRLTTIYEDPASLNYSTSYGYDVLDDLTTVSQGTQTRTFVYDSLKRLTSATNPESGTISYQYDANSNLVVKTDARAASSHYSYDALNRPLRRWYNGSNLTTATNNNSPALPAGVGASDEAGYFYDAQTLPAGAPSFSRGYSTGRLVAMTYGSGSSAGDYYGYDAAGRALLKIQQTGGINYQTSALYNLAGGRKGETYPSLRTVSYAYDSAGRTSSFTGKLGDGVDRNYATEIIYSPLGGMTKEKFGTDTALYNKLFYNSRGQLAEIREGTSYTGPNDTGWERGAIINYYGDCWGMCGGSNSTTPMANNNGNLKKQEIFVPSASSWLQQYDYDNLNRLQGVSESAVGTTLWRQEYVYDRWGNRTIHQTNTWGVGIPKPNFGVATASNRLTPPVGYTMSYDAAGNLTNDTYTGAGTRTYDAENRMTTAWGGNNQSQVYNYNADGQRTRRTVDGVETWQIYGMDGELVAEYAANGLATSPQKEYGYRNGQLLVTAEAPLPEQNVIWTSVTSTLQVTGNSLQKTSGTSSWYDAGAVSTQSITSGDGYVEFTPGNTTTWRMIGLGNGNTGIHYSDIEYALFVGPSGGLQIYEAGILRGSFGTYAGADRLRVAVEGGVVKYRKNGALVYTSTVAPTYPLLVDTSFNTVNSAVYNVVLAASSGGGIKWLVTDQLGTPRMVFDKTGALARHDYLPFGEELFAGQGSRTTTQGYPTSPNSSDGVRQKFTRYERDTETALDYAQARYYSSVQGRFTSVDPLMRSASIDEPQTFNRYSYVLNNPMNSTDPTGLCPKGRKCYTQKDGKGKDVEYYDLDDGTPVVVTNTTLVVSLSTVTAPPAFEPIYRSIRVWQIVPKAAPVASTPGTGVVAKFFGAIGLILTNPISVGCGQTRNTISDGSGGCMHDPNADNKVDTSENEKDDQDSEVDRTPETDPDDFEPVRGRDAKRNKTTKEIWVKDRLHRDHYEVYKNLRKFERGIRNRAVWSDGRPKPL